MIANAIGRKDERTVKQAVHTSVLAAFIGGLIVTLLGELFIGHLLNLLHVPDEVFSYALLYIRIYLLGMPVIFLYNFEAAIFRSTGETRVPLVALAFSGVLNVLLNLVFVVLFKITVNGVVIAVMSSGRLYRNSCFCGTDPYQWKVSAFPFQQRSSGNLYWLYPPCDYFCSLYFQSAL